MLEIYYKIFVISFLVTIVIKFIGFFIDIFDIDGMDIPGFDMPLLNVFPMKPNNLLLISITFSGVGYCLTNSYGNWDYRVILCISIICSIIINLLVNRFIIMPMKKVESEFNISRNQLIGTEMIIHSAIQKNGFGQVRYTLNGKIQTAPGKSIDGEFINTNEKVILENIDKNTFIVKKKI